ncbi:hypothetical protein H4R34_003331 [Dimargaris verticillata]|uniref:UBA domain-containing protein n=1 Tax=Dimargaris verticillata TaxID=2761393 RepID=A0A9W8EC42_9FUNG|nr:hypothetical protein H4R34_003331 [Dimargaris verticillata]
MRSGEISSIYRGVADVPFGAQFDFEFPTPVSLPFDYIMVTDSVSSIPKYDFSLEKKLANEMEGRRRREQLETLTNAQKKRNAENTLFARHAATSSLLTTTGHVLSLDHRHSVAVSGHALAALGRPTVSASPLSNGRPASADLTHRTPISEVANSPSPRPHALTPDPIKPPPAASYLAYSPPKATSHAGYAASSYHLPTATTAPFTSAAETTMPPAASFATLPHSQLSNASQSIPNMGPPQSSVPMAPSPTTMGSPPFSQHQHQQHPHPNANARPPSGYPALSSPPITSMAPQWSQSPPVYAPHYASTMPMLAPVSSPPPHPPAVSGPGYPPLSHHYNYSPNPVLPPRPHTTTARPPVPNPPSHNPAPPPLPPKTFQLSDYDYIQSAHPNTLLPPSGSHPAYLPPNSMLSANYPNIANPAMPDHNQYLGQASLSPLGPTGEDDEHTVEQVRQLIAMGFSRAQAVHALEAYDYDLSKATNYLLDHS